MSRQRDAYILQSKELLERLAPPKHTPGPWSVDSERTGACTIGTRAVEIARLDTENGDRDHANAARIVACVNACEGLEDPSEGLLSGKDARELVALLFAATVRLNSQEHHISFIADAEKRAREYLAKAGGN